MKKSAEMQLVEKQFGDTPIEVLMEERLAQGESLEAIASQFGVHPLTVRSWANALGWRHGWHLAETGTVSV